MQPTYHYQIGDEIQAIAVQSGDGHLRVRVGDRTYAVRAALGDRGQLDLAIEGRRLRTYVVQAGNTVYVSLDGTPYTFTRPVPQRRRAGHGASLDASKMEAAMPGLVLDVLVAENDLVRKGDPLVLLEAMKMELRMAAPADGRVVKVHCRAGQVVERGQLLVELQGG